MRTLFILLLYSLSAQAQEEEKVFKGIKVDVIPRDFSPTQMAVPRALNLGGAADTRGVTEALSGTVIRDLKISGHFHFIPESGYLSDPSKEGIEPKFKDWFNAGTQGLVKTGYRIKGKQVTVEMRLYSIDSSERIRFAAPYDKAVTLPLNIKKLRAHAHGFVNNLLLYYTKSPGFFLSKIVFARRTSKGKAIYMVSPDGHDEGTLVPGDQINMLPSYSGGRIFFTSFRNGGPELFSYSGGRVHPFAGYKGLNTGAVLSPNGSSVAATLSKDGNPEIYLLNPADGSVKARLTNNWSIDTSPSWSPDGKRICFVSDRHGSPQIWVMNADGSGKRRITLQGEYNQTPVWSPRGDLIAFTARDERHIFDIFVVDPATKKIERLTQNQGNNEEPTWSPGGRYLAFTSTRNGASQLYIMTADGRSQTQISRGKGGYLTPSWGR